MASMSHDSVAGYAGLTTVRTGKPREPRMRNLLGDIVAEQVVPQLVHRLWPLEPTPAHEAELTQVVLSHDAAAATAWARHLLSQGMSFESLCLGVLGPTARRLGDMWLEDVCDFADVTLGMGRLQHVLHMLAPLAPASSPDAPERRALLAAMPGEQHTFGLSVLVQAFRAAGWLVTKPLLNTIGDLSALVAKGGFELVGLSVGSQERLGPVPGAIAAIRAAAQPCGVRVMLGGPIFPARPHLAVALGADFTAADAPAAVRAAETMLDRTATLQ